MFMKQEKEKSMYYIITSEPQEWFDCNGKSLGLTDKLAVFYCPSIGRRRYYRQTMTKPQKGLKLLTFKTQKAAIAVLEITNSISWGGWDIETIWM